jgi:hypothetical protein
MSSCTKVSIKTKPKLWESVKARVKAGSKGGPPNKWSARKSQLAVKLYKKAGGGYKGPKSSCNSLSKWSREKWGYVGAEKKSRYLPEKVRKMLSSSEKKRENRLKGSKLGSRIRYSKSVKDKMKRAGIF